MERRFRVTVYCSDGGAPDYDYDDTYGSSPEKCIAELRERCKTFARIPTRFYVTDTETMERYEIKA